MGVSRPQQKSTALLGKICVWEKEFVGSLAIRLIWTHLMNSTYIYRGHFEFDCFCQFEGYCTSPWSGGSGEAFRHKENRTEDPGPWDFFENAISQNLSDHPITSRESQAEQSRLLSGASLSPQPWCKSDEASGAVPMPRQGIEAMPELS